MRRTNIYLDEEQLKALKHRAAEDGKSVATLVRDAVDDYLVRERTAKADLDARWDALMARRRAIAAELDIPPEVIEADITAARQEVRELRRAQHAAGGR